MVDVRLIAFGLAWLCLAAGSALAAPPTTYDQVLAAALTKHPAVLGKRSLQASAQADKEGAEWARYPTPSVEATRRGGTDGAGLLRIDQPLWTGGRITSGIDVAERRLNAADAAVEEARLDLSLRVITAYLEALRQKGRESHARAGVREHEKLLDMINRRAKQEVSSQTDQRLAESRLYQASNELSQISQALRSALTQLSQLSGERVDDVAWSGLGDRDAPPSFEAALHAALQASPTMQRLKHEEEAAASDIELKRAAYMPQLALRLEREAGGGTIADSRAMIVLLAQPGAGLSAVSGVDAAVARREAARQALEGADRDVRQRIALDWDEMLAARSRTEAAMRSSEMSSEVFDSYTRQYVIGRKSWLDVLNSVREAVQAKYTLEDARTQTVAAAMRLRAQMQLSRTE